MGGVYIGQGKNGRRTHLGSKVVPICAPSPFGCFWQLPLLTFLFILEVHIDLFGPIVNEHGNALCLMGFKYCLIAIDPFTKVIVLLTYEFGYGLTCSKLILGWGQSQTLAVLGHSSVCFKQCWRIPVCGLRWNLQKQQQNNPNQ